MVSLIEKAIDVLVRALDSNDKKFELKQQVDCLNTTKSYIFT